MLQLAVKLILCQAILFIAACCTFAAQRPPNVVLMMTDDQGYGDLACHGNEMIQTPHLDTLAKQSVRMTNFHVDPTCSETRSALMTGRYSSRTGVWHTIMGRSILRGDEVTMADVFSASGYQTGIFGKWHLGDNYPFRPQDRGFGEVLINGGGGVTQTPDYWGNDYFDDTYFHNGKPEKQQGYCTDVWFRAGMKFIETNKDRPFFCYIPTNAPHGPFNVAEKYSGPYVERGVPPTMAKFYGMITNIDENVGRMVEHLDKLGLAENTILIFMTDNGTAAGVARGKPKPGQWKGFNDGMRGQKGSQYEGGHRVPCFVRWPGGGIGGARDVAELSAHIDLLPTLIDLCHLKTPSGVALDGASRRPLLLGKKSKTAERTLFVHSQRVEQPDQMEKVLSHDPALAVGRRRRTLRHHCRPRPTARHRRQACRGRRSVTQRLRGVVEQHFEAIRRVFANRRRSRPTRPHHTHLPRLARANRRRALEPGTHSQRPTRERLLGHRRRRSGHL